MGKKKRFGLSYSSDPSHPQSRTYNLRRKKSNELQMKQMRRSLKTRIRLNFKKTFLTTTVYLFCVFMRVYAYVLFYFHEYVVFVYSQLSAMENVTPTIPYLRYGASS